MKKEIDWKLIKREYRLGQLSVRIIASAHGIAHTTISRRAKKEGWVQDKTEEVRQKTNIALLAPSKKGKRTKRTTLTKQDVDVAVQTRVHIVNNHQKIISKGNKLIDYMFTQLAKIKNEDPKKQIRSHAGIVKDLSIAIKNLIPLERQAFNLDDKNRDPVDSFSEILNNIAGATRGLPNRSQRKIRE